MNNDDRAAALDRLLFTYAVAVSNLLHLLRRHHWSEYPDGAERLAAAFKEVRELTESHLLPAPPESAHR
jgi:hypothetical protein